MMELEAVCNVDKQVLDATYTPGLLWMKETNDIPANDVD